MGLSDELISQFAKVTNDDSSEVKNGVTVNGTAVAYNGKIYVRLDGSDQLTPVISSTAGMRDGDRVTVLIKDHTATVTGNTSSPSASSGELDDLKGEIGDQIAEFEIIIADKVSAEELEVEKGRIDDLVSENILVKDKLTATEAEIKDLTADNVTIKGDLEAQNAEIEELKTTKLDVEIADLKYATIENLEATNADIHNLEADYGEFKDLTADRFTAIDADIKDLDAEKLSADEAEIKFANIDFANIGKAAIENFFSKSGMIGDLVVGDGTITGTLVGVTIKGDLIEGGTVVADKLVIKGEDGLYYKLNTNGENVGAEQTEYNSLNGSVITAKSITAEKISVKDLVAFGATIGGFHITDSALHSGVKESVDNTTRGTFMDDTGQFAIGDSQNYLKFFKDQNGKWKLVLSASEILLGSSSHSLDDTTVSTTLEYYLSTSDTTITGGSWSETSPKPVKEKYIWTRTKTTKANGEVEYSEPVCLTTGDSLDDLAIGGRNLALDTNKGITWWTWSMQLGKYTKEPVEVNGVMAVKLTRTEVEHVGTYSVIMYSNIQPEIYEPNTEYTVSFDVLSNTSGSFRFTFSEADGSDTFADAVKSNNFIANEWTNISVTIRTKETLPESRQQRLYITNMPNKLGQEYTFKNLKIEKGNIATAYTPAPEDIDQHIQDVQDTANQAQNDANNAILQNAETQAALKILEDSISTLVTDENGQSLMTQTGSGWSFNIGGLQSGLDKATSDIAGIQGDIGEVEALANKTNQLANDIAEKTAYINMATDEKGNPCMELGKTDSEFKLRITNTSIDFIQGTQKIAYVTNRQLYIQSSVVTDEMQIGDETGFIWKRRSNGNMGLRWKG